MTVEELTDVLSGQLTPVVDTMTSMIELMIAEIALIGVLAGIVLAILLWRRF